MISAPACPPADLKATCNRVHATRRAAERFALELDANALAAIEAMIRASPSDGCRPLRPDHFYEDRALYAVRLAGKWYPVVFDAATDSVITFPPEQALWPYYSVLMPVPRLAPSSAGRSAEEDRPAVSNRAIANRVTGDLPGVPELSGAPSITELTAVVKAVNQRRVAVAEQLGDMTRSDWRRQPLIDEQERLTGVSRELKRRKIELHRQIQAGKIGIPPASYDDPLWLLVAAYKAFGTIGARVGWKALTESEHAVRQAIEEYVTKHSPGSPAGAEAPTP